MLSCLWCRIISINWLSWFSAGYLGDIALTDEEFKLLTRLNRENRRRRNQLKKQVLEKQVADKQQVAAGNETLRITSEADVKPTSIRKQPKNNDKDNDDGHDNIDELRGRADEKRTRKKDDDLDEEMDQRSSFHAKTPMQQSKYVGLTT